MKRGLRVVWNCSNTCRTRAQYPCRQWPWLSSEGAGCPVHQASPLTPRCCTIPASMRGGRALAKIRLLSFFWFRDLGTKRLLTWNTETSRWWHWRPCFKGIEPSPKPKIVGVMLCFFLNRAGCSRELVRGIRQRGRRVSLGRAACPPINTLSHDETRHNQCPPAIVKFGNAKSRSFSGDMNDHHSTNFHCALTSSKFCRNALFGAWKIAYLLP